MDEHSIRKALEGGGGRPGALLRAGLWFPGKVYGGLMEARRIAYRCGLVPSVKASVPVVSVGNLTAGGSGKTPFVALLVRELAARGRRPGILLRGYRQSAGGVSDEAELYRSLCPGTIVETGSDRRLSAERAVGAGADVLVMDDGFQHLRLQRDLDIVLVDATSPWGGGNTIPGGLLREPKTALSPVRAVVITRSDQREPVFVEALRREIALLAPSALIIAARHRPARLRDLAGRDIPLESLRGKPVVALAGIARPEAFHRTLADLGAILAGSIDAGDHHPLSRAMVEKALRLASEKGGGVVTTEKDRAKEIFSALADNTVDNGDIWMLGVEQELEDLEKLLDLLVATLGI